MKFPILPPSDSGYSVNYSCYSVILQTMNKDTRNIHPCGLSVWIQANSPFFLIFISIILLLLLILFFFLFFLT